MSITTYTPNYHDDYVTSQNGDKNYLRILFKPGYSVQVRELNQLQSALQDQINRLGSSVWKKDVAVIGGKASFLPAINSVKLDLSFTLSGTSYTTAYVAENAKTIVDTLNELRGEVLGYELVSGNIYKFYYTYTNSGNGGEKTFGTDVNRSHRIILKSTDSTIPEINLPSVSNARLSESGATGYASAVVCESGVFFTKGSFVAVPTQTIFLDKVSVNTTFTGYATLEINENIVSYSNDNSLLDNANGTPNYSAPGADRYQIDLSLAWITKTDYESSTNISEYIKLLYVNDSRPEEIILADEYAEINNILAKRTSEESGNYTVNPFGIQVRELYDGDALPVNCIVSGTTYKIQSLGTTTLSEWTNIGAGASPAIGTEFVAGVNATGIASVLTTTGSVSEVEYIHGVYKADNLDVVGYTLTPLATKKAAITDAKGKYNVTLEPSVAYVDGYRINLDRALNLNAPKARETTAVNVDISANIGSYFIGDIQTGILPTLSTVTNTYTLYSSLGGSAGRSGTTVTITAAAHGLSNGNTILVRSSEATIPNASYTIGGVTANTFTITTTDNNTTLSNIIVTFSIVIGTCKIRAFETTGIGTSEYRCYVYDIAFSGTSTADWNIRRFDNINKIAGNSFEYNVTSDNLLQQTNNTSVFPLPYNAARTLEGVTFYAQQYFTGTTGDGGVIVLNAQDNTIFSDADGTVVVVNNAVRASRTITVSSDSRTLTITPTSSAWSSSVTYSITAKVQVTNANLAARVTKSIASVTDSITVSNGVSNVFYLSKTDIIRIKTVTHTSNSNNDITSLFELFDDGQRDTHYTNGRVRYIGSAALTGTISVEYEHYARFGNDILSRRAVMYTADSYSSNNNSVGTLYEDIPSYNGVKLSDVIDFRHDLVYGMSGGALGSLTANENKLVLDPNTPISALVTFYLPRIDKVVVNSSSQFSILQGVPSLTPVEPNSPKNAMTLYTLEIPAYTADVNDIVKNYVDNRRYTMRDIGAIESRISNIEYYTSLSLLERSANDKPIFDSAGERFKNGILVDNFIGHGVGDVFDPTYACSVDRASNILRPRYNTNNVDLVIDSSTTIGTTGIKTADNGKIRIHDSLITLNYDEVELVSHLKATDHISVHPHIYAKISGSIRLSPSADNWKDTITRPDLVVQDDSAFDAIRFIAEDPSLDILGTDWNNWERAWGGTSTTRRRVRRGRRRGTQTITSTDFTDTRTGTLTTLSETNIQKSLGENVVETAIIPFIRSRRVYFQATGLKASTRVYPYFDDKDISSYTNSVIGNDSGKFIVPTTISDNITLRFDDVETSGLPAPESGFTAYGAPLITDASGQLFGSFIIPNNDSMRFRTGERAFKLTDDVRNSSSESSFASTQYIASGILETRQETILSTKTPQFNVEQLSETRSGVVTNVRTRWSDPIAQSFLIDPNEFPEGVFITSVDVYFQRKALADSVEVYVVTMENGAPTSTVVPYSRKSLNPSDVSVSTDGTSATNFAFTDPVYLKADEEYALVVSSNSGEYRCWYAILGNVDVDTGKRVEKQEYLGTFFTSANTSTWTPQQEQDLKFRINRADFVTGPANIDFRTQLHTGVESITVGNAGSGYTEVPTVIITPVSGTGGSGATADAILNPLNNTISAIRITNRGSGYILPPTISFSGGGSGIVAVAEAVATLVEVPVSVYNLRQPNLLFNSATIDHSIQFGTQSPVLIEKGINNYIQREYSNLNSHVLKSIGQTTFAGPRAIVKSTLSTVDSALSPVIDIDGSSLLTITNIVNNDSTDEGYTVYESGTATGGSTTTLVKSGAGWATNVYVGQILKITSGDLSGKEFTITANNSTTLTFSPTATSAVANLMTYSIVRPLANGSALARYITRKVDLNDPADLLNVYISTNRPTADSNIKVYVKLGFDTSTPFDKVPWVELNPTTPIPINSDTTVYSESEYIIDPNDDFISFQVKVVMLSNNIFDIPTVRDFRAIATV